MRIKIATRKELIRFSKKLVNLAARNDIELKIIGSVAVDVLCGYKVPTKKVISDIDLVGRQNQLEKILELFRLFADLDMESESTVFKGHYIFKGKKEHFSQVILFDIYIGELTFNHHIPEPYFDKKFKFTIPVTTLLISKLAIVNLAYKDIKGILNILYFHELGTDEEKNQIQLGFLMKTWAAGWKGWEISKTCTDNLQIIKNILLKCKTEFSKSIVIKIDILLTHNNRIRKNCCWRTRDFIGTKFKYYQIAD